MRTKENYYFKEMPNKIFNIDIGLSTTWNKGANLQEHWHEHLQIFYFINGTAYLECDKKPLTATKGDIVIINSNELHYFESCSNNLKFYLIRVDLLFLFSNNIDLCQLKYLTPLSESFISFKNLIRNDIVINNCIQDILDEFSEKAIGYELAIKSNLYTLFTLLFRNHIKNDKTRESFRKQIQLLNKINPSLEFINKNFLSQINTNDLATLSHISPYYFSRIFKKCTNQTPTDYINSLRLKKSIDLLKNSNLNITEIALSCGFNDINYFSRIFKKKYGISPSKFIDSIK